MSWKVTHEIPEFDLRPASQGGSGVSALVLRDGTSEYRMGLLKSAALALCCLFENIKRGLSS